MFDRIQESLSRRIIILIVVAGIILGILIPKVFIQSKVLPAPTLCPNAFVDEDPVQIAYIHRDHPLQRLLTMKLAVSNIRADRIYLTAYTFFGFPISVIELHCDGGITTVRGL